MKQEENISPASSGLLLIGSMLFISSCPEGHLFLTEYELNQMRPERLVITSCTYSLNQFRKLNVLQQDLMLFSIFMDVLQN